MIFDPPGNKMLATRLDCLIGSELSEPSRAKLTLTERISCSVRGFPSQAELRACSVRLGSLPSLTMNIYLSIGKVKRSIYFHCTTHYFVVLSCQPKGNFAS